MMRMWGWLLPLLFCCVCDACTAVSEAGSSDPSCAPDSVEIDTMLAPLVRGDYDSFVETVASCNGQPESYRHQVAMAFKQRFSRTPFGRYRISRVEMPRDSVADVFLLVEMPQGEEEILFRFIYTERGWQFR